MADHNRKETGDSSWTLYHQGYNEDMHSREGAYAEALYRHVMPSGVLAGNAKEIRILDTGFGIGYNILATISEISRIGNERTVEFISLESDRSYGNAMKEVSFGDERDNLYEKIVQAYHDGRVEWNGFAVRVLFGDAREIVKTLGDEYFDAVFHDPFSPGKNPELWSVDFFLEYSRVVKETAVITTYSSAPQVRRAFIEAGFFIGKNSYGEIRKEGTTASISGNLRYAFSPEEIRDITGDIRSIPYRDSNLADSRDAILRERIQAMSRARAGHEPG